MSAVLKRQTDIIVILPTGGGKSMLAIVPSLLEANMTTVLVLPLNSLIMDYERRLSEMNVPYQVYKSNSELNLQDNLVIISADKSQTASWRAALANLVHRKPLARIIVDEAHIPLVAKGYRKPLKHVCDVRSMPAPLVLLSATLPPSFISHVSSTYLLLSNTVTFRQCTNRPELKYMLEKTDKESDLAQRALQIVQAQQRTWKEQDRGLVFVPSVGMCMELARSSGWHSYVGHKETMDDEDRKREYNAWREGRNSRVMIATSAFSTGNDHPHVRLVLHVDKPFDMLEYIQGQGRAGRDGTPAVCHTLVPTKAWKESKKEDELERDNEQAVLDHLYFYGTRRCLRYGITSYVDGIGTSCVGDDLNQRCSVCQRDPRHHPQEIPMATNSHQKSMPTATHTVVSAPHTFSEATERAKVLKATRELGKLSEAECVQHALRSCQNLCCICLVHNTNSAANRHTLSCCPCFGDRIPATWDLYKDWRYKLKYNRKHHDKICFICHVPQISDELHPTFTKAGKKGSKIECQYADIIGPMVFAVYHDVILKARAEAHFGTQLGGNLTAFADWLMGMPRACSHSNLMDLFMWYMETQWKQ